MISIGCDVGAMATKTVIVKDGSIAAYNITPNKDQLTQAAQHSVQRALSHIGISLNEITYRAGTGQGEKYIPFSHTSVSMISCLAKGVHWAEPAARTVVDIGGLSTTVVSINRESGQVMEYRANDRCASGTGFFLELSAQALELKVEELGQISLSAKGRAYIGAQCAVFGESEIVTHVNDGVEPADIAAGTTYAIGASVASMVKRLGTEREIVVTGGVAKNEGVIKALEEKLGVETVDIQLDSQIICALGAALLALERTERIRGEADVCCRV